MEENLVQEMQIENQEPTLVDNSGSESVSRASFKENQAQEEGQSLKDPTDELILGKFKSVDELAKAYSELQKYQGESSQELGRLRKESSSLNTLKESLETMMAISGEMEGLISEAKEKYNQPEYFQEQTFRDFYKEAITALGKNLDTEKFINLLESYVKTRIIAHDKSKLAAEETQMVIDSMNYEKNSKTSFTPPKKHFDEMTTQEIDELLEKFI